MIRIIITGGTIDKQYNELNGELYLPQTHVPAMLRQARCTLKVELEQVMLKDSLDMQDTDREKVKNSCLNAIEDKIVITHGTDTMVETAKHIADSINNKTIVLLGAMIPYTVSNSDALFNLGCAVSAAQTLQHGVYITMNGKIFAWDDVKKIKTAGEFDYL
jgi:L-asparaginase